VGLRARGVRVHASKKEELLRSLSGERTPTAADRLLVSEMLTKVEATCPETQPAYSALMNGEWEVVYSGGVSPGPVPSPTREIALLMYAGGFTPGSFLLSAGNKLPENLLYLSKPVITICPTQPRACVTVSATAFGNQQELILRTKLEAESPGRLRETYYETEVAGNTIPLPDPLKWERLLFVTYIDASMMVVRDETGAPDILLRQGGAVAAPLPTMEKKEAATDFVDVPIDVETTDYEME